MPNIICESFISLYFIVFRCFIFLLLKILTTTKEMHFTSHLVGRDLASVYPYRIRDSPFQFYASSFFLCILPFNLRED